VEVHDVISEETRVEAARVSRAAMSNLKAGRAFEDQAIRRVVSEILEEVLRDPQVLIHLNELRALNDYTFNHSVGVCLLSLLIGAGMGYNKDSMRELGLGAILHDVGKMLVPDHILHKPALLSPQDLEEIKKHPLNGYELLTRKTNLAASILKVPLQHHERVDGKGYPHGLKGHEISQYARVVAVADVYDALTTDRPYRYRFYPHEAVNILRSRSGTHLEGEMVEQLVRHVAIYPIGSRVVLSTGEVGVVIEVNRDLPSRPLVKIIIDRRGEVVRSYQTVNLLASPEITILRPHTPEVPKP